MFTFLFVFFAIIAVLTTLAMMVEDHYNRKYEMTLPYLCRSDIYK